MKKFSAIILSVILCAMSVIPVFADDAMKVITFPGQEEQKQEEQKQEQSQTVQPQDTQTAQPQQPAVPYLALGADLSPEQLATVLTLMSSSTSGETERYMIMVTATPSFSAAGKTEFQ